MPTWQQLDPYGQDPARTVQELQQEAVGLGLSPNGGVVQLRARITRHIAAQTDQQAQAPWAPPNWQQPQVQPAQPQQAQQPPVTPVATPPTPVAQPAAQPQAANARRFVINQVLAGLASLAILFLLITAIVLLATRDNNGGNNGTPASGGQSTTQAAPTQTTALNENQVKEIATKAANDAITAAGLASKIDVQKLVNDAVAQAITAFKANQAMTANDVQKTASDYVRKQAQKAGGNQGGSWTPTQKCEWLRGHFPQTTASVQALGAKLANVQTQRVATHLFPCDATNTVFDGFIVLGPNEGYSGSFSIDVPANGAVDSYPGATFTGTNRRIGSETIRGTSGKVTATRATYWPWDDDNPPTGASAANTNQPASDNVCMLGKDLALQMKWPLIGDQSDDITKYGGARIHLDSAAQLPTQWEGISGGRKIATDSSDHTMVQGDWSIYPPPGACRDQLGVAK